MLAWTSADVMTFCFALHLILRGNLCLKMKDHKRCKNIFGDRGVEILKRFENHWSLSIEYHRVYKKNYTIILYFCIFSKRFTEKTSCITESCKSEKCLEKAYLRVKVEKMILKICKKDVFKLPVLEFFVVLVLIVKFRF